MNQIHVRVNSYGPDRPLMMVYTDPISGKKVGRSTSIKDTGPKARREAERLAAVWEDELNGGRYKPPSRVTWQEFRQRIEEEKLVAMSSSGQTGIHSVLNHLERTLNPDKLAKLTTPAISRFVKLLRDEGMKETTLGFHLRNLKSALNWAVKMGLLAAAPIIDVPRAGESKGRPISGEEFERMLAAVPKVRPRDPGVWQRYLMGLWLSGLRLSESLIVSWDGDAPFAVDVSGRYPGFRIAAEAQKGRRSEKVPITPDFAEWLLQTPEDDREGLVFPLASLTTGHQLQKWQAGNVVSAIGEKAGVVVNKDQGKYASAHDLRRSFGTRWASRVKPATLQRLMRHTRIQTSMRYYVSLDADDVAAELWAHHPKNGNTFGNTGAENPWKYGGNRG